MAAYVVNNPERGEEDLKATYGLLDFMLGPWYGAKITLLRGYMTNPQAPEYAKVHPDEFSAQEARIAEITAGVQRKFEQGGPGRTAGRPTSTSTRRSGSASRLRDAAIGPLFGMPPGHRWRGCSFGVPLLVIAGFILGLCCAARDQRVREEGFWISPAFTLESIGCSSPAYVSRCSSGASAWRAPRPALMLLIA